MEKLDRIKELVALLNKAGKSYYSEGQLGGNTEKYEAFNIGGTIFYILAGVTGVICVVSVVSQKKKK